MNKKIYYIVGTPGTGKSTISFKENYTKIDLDNIRWDKNWNKVSYDNMKIIIKDMILNNQNLIFEGSYIELIDFFYNNGATIIYIKIPLLICLKRIFFRTIYRIKNNIKVCNDNKESIYSFFKLDGLLIYTIKTHFKLKKFFKNNYICENIYFNNIEGAKICQIKK